MTSGQGRVKIINRNENSFEYEVTAIQGTFRVAFSTSEKWMHTSTNGDFEYKKSVFEYMADLRTEIAQRIKDDEASGTFDVI